MKVSVICTVLNEADSMESLLTSLLSQTKPADEIVIVDGGSQDGTADIVDCFMRASTPVHLSVAAVANIARGRNIAIELANHDIIASIVGGCTADRHWLQNLVEPFEGDGNIDVVGGFWLAETKSAFEECLAELIYPQIETLDEAEFLPSGRSIAFRRECWEAVGGYPEWLYTGEDSLFDLTLRDAGCKFVFAEDAVVYWRPRTTWRGLFQQYYLYAKGAAEANIVSRTIFKAYGANVLGHILHVVKSLILRKRIRCLCYAFLSLAVILAAKLAGLVAGKLQRSAEQPG